MWLTFTKKGWVYDKVLRSAWLPITLQSTMCMHRQFMNRCKLVQTGIDLCPLNCKAVDASNSWCLHELAFASAWQRFWWNTPRMRQGQLHAHIVTRETRHTMCLIKTIAPQVFSRLCLRTYMAYWTSALVVTINVCLFGTFSRATPLLGPCNS